MPTARKGGRPRIKVRVAIAAALLLRRLPPRHLRSVMRRAAARARPADYARTERHYFAVTATHPRCAGWQGCLPRSIAVALLCRTEGTWPQWCTGVRTTPPFAAHAWLEAEERIVAEPGTPGAYQALLRVEAGRGR
ncbi:lasso peptide biosynthesis B2 protein [Streptomyces sp. HUAS TT7]|uniref:lasso peptide biosynthesis B2 protein n=1 Tax=Streptomyces sp. HUAS TT7 TaxID=3447507 RepID=UPI003F65A879